VTARTRGAIVALAAALTCGWLGTSVSEMPPAGIDLAGRAVAGELPQVALVFTNSGTWPVLVGLGVVAIVLAELVHEWRARVLFSTAMTLIAWQASDGLKHIFHRTRPDYWLLKDETSWSYPSGHAMFAVIVYGLWSYYFARSDLPLPARFGLSAAFGLWGIGVIWSRLALGAHFVTDLIGGVLFGITAIGVAAAIVGGIPGLHWRVHREKRV
jgi:membrane-associated phospholipid phosphatase